MGHVEQAPQNMEHVRRAGLQAAWVKQGGNGALGSDT
jgi:hypothetical protein